MLGRVIERLRARATEVWPSLRDLVFTYHAGDADPRHFEAALPELEVSPIAHAIFATLAPGRALPALEPVAGNTYDWGHDAAAITPEGDGLLVADYAVRERARDVGPSRTVYHVVVRDELCAMLETGSAAQRVATPRLVVQVAATPDAIDAATDAILELAPAFGLTFVERNDVPNTVVRQRRSSAAVRAFERVMAIGGSGTAQEFAWIVISMVPDWFDFAPEAFVVSAGDSSIELIWKNPSHPNRRATIELTSSRNIECVATEDNRRIDRGGMSMHYTPSREQYQHARETLRCALHWLDHPVELSTEIRARILPGRVFPT